VGITVHVIVDIDRRDLTDAAVIERSWLAPDAFAELFDLGWAFGVGRDDPWSSR
jgi:hypothetical protein